MLSAPFFALGNVVRFPRSRKTTVIIASGNSGYILSEYKLPQTVLFFKLMTMSRSVKGRLAQVDNGDPARAPLPLNFIMKLQYYLECSAAFFLFVSAKLYTPCLVVGTACMTIIFSPLKASDALHRKASGWLACCSQKWCKKVVFALFLFFFLINFHSA